MRIIQLIDSLDIGGAERMAVSYANSLEKSIEFSGLVASRKEGELKNKMDAGVSYLFLNRKKSVDLNAIFNLRNYCKNNKVQIIQAHSSSFFLACMVKLMLPKIAIIWHDHYGNFVPPKRKNSFFIRIFSVLFQGVIAVDFDLEAWSKKNLFCKNVIYLQNYIPENKEYSRETILHGIDGKRVLYLANLRSQKNHLMLVEVVNSIYKKFPDWTFHLVGSDLKDDYSETIKAKIKNYQLEEVIFLYGAKKDVENVIKQSDIGVFTSNSEGLPLALLEFGLYKKPVIATNVGQIPFVIKQNISGFISEPKDVIAFSTNLATIQMDEKLRVKFGDELHKTITENYRENVVISNYISWISKIKI
ncbi:glycosyltransferase [Flavobacterium sp.]|uniref:glycosyltransferase n=1 Tax=Flavobacterium sp. TaxID=239 RepID=UPI003BB9FFC9